MTFEAALATPKTRHSRAFVYDRFGPPRDVLQQIDRPLSGLKAGCVRVEMALAPINPSDLIPITGAYPHRISLSAVGGYEGVGRVTAVSQGHEHLMRKRVLPLRAAGTWQTFVECPAVDTADVPGAPKSILMVLRTKDLSKIYYP